MMKYFCQQFFKQEKRNFLFRKEQNRFSHSQSSQKRYSETLRVIQVPILADNYSFLLINEKISKAIVVDPAEPKTILQFCEKEKVEITSIFTTHHHWDHAGGNEELKNTLPKLKIFGADDRIPKMTKKVAHGDEIETDLGFRIQCISSPCHTSGHVLYFIPNKTPILFSGDTLFFGGCGKFFEGEPRDMHEALNKKIASLPRNTEIYCGHEYTVGNLSFGQFIEPKNKDIAEKLSWAKKQREQKLSTLPTTLDGELKWNVFMRVNEPDVRKSVGLGEKDSPVEVMRKLRSAKDNFKN